MDKREKTGRVISDATLDRYLEAILVLGKRRAIVRSVDVAGYLGYSKACVCVAVKQMIQEALVLVEGHGALVLSETGKQRAKAHLERSDYILGLLLDSGVEAEAARQEADAITRALTGASYQALRSYLSSFGVHVSAASAE